MKRRSRKKVRLAAIVPAAGRGTRLRSRTPKPYVHVAGKPLFVHTLRSLLAAYPFCEVRVVVDRAMLKKARQLLDRYGMRFVQLTIGGKTRAESVRRGIRSLDCAASHILIHDAARPQVSKALVRRTILAAIKSGAALCALPISSTVKRRRQGSHDVETTEDRSNLFLAQTPQVFKSSLLKERYATLGAKAVVATDEAALFDGSRVRVRLVSGEEANLKVTTPGDLALFRLRIEKK